MKGYIGVTSREWFHFLAEKNYQDKINFWRKNTKQFKVLETGEPFFFLVKNEKGVKTERAVLGMATFERFEVNTVEQAWNTYTQGNGDPNKESFKCRMQEMFQTTETQSQIGCIILSNFKVFDRPVSLSQLQIDFQNSVVSGKGITEHEVELIQKYAFKSFSSVVKELNEVYEVGFSEDDESFPEGKQELREHLSRERNRRVIQLSKSKFKEQHGKLYCQVCGFDFEQTYGPLGEDYIEGHHTKPVSEMADGEETKIEDIAMVCANCHRMLHRKRPWLSLQELNKLLNENNKG